MEKSYVLSYDVGTGSVKTVIVDFEGNVVGFANANYALLTLKPVGRNKNPKPTGLRYAFQPNRS